MEPAKIVGTWPLYIHYGGEHGQGGGLELLAQGEFTVSTNIMNSIQTVTTKTFDLAKEVEWSSKIPIFLVVLTNEEPTNSSSFFKKYIYIGKWSGGGNNNVTATGSNNGGLNAQPSGGTTVYSVADEGVYITNFSLTLKPNTIPAAAIKGSFQVNYKYMSSGVSNQAKDPRGKYSYKVYLLPITVES